MIKGLGELIACMCMFDVCGGGWVGGRGRIKQTFREEFAGLHCATAQGNAQGDEPTIEGK
jgi:hypothetical protein